MIIRATRTRRVPVFYTRHVMRLVQSLVAAHPGFHRLVISIEPHPAVHTGWLVSPEVEPQVRRLLSRVLILDEPVYDDEPWEAL